MPAQSRAWTSVGAIGEHAGVLLTRSALVVLALAWGLGCGPRAAGPASASVAGSEAEEPAEASVASAPDPLDVLWTSPLDHQSSVRILDGTIYESGWGGIARRDLSTGALQSLFAGSEASFRPRMGVDEAFDPVLIPMGDLVLGRDRDARVGRFDAESTAPRWTSPSCVRLYAAVRSADGGEVVLYCAAMPSATGVAPGELLRLDAATGSQVGAPTSLPPSSWFDAHGLLAIGDVIVVRMGERVLSTDASNQVLFSHTIAGSYGLAATDLGVLVVAPGFGLVELDPRTGAQLRVLPAPHLAGAPDPFTGRLGDLVVEDGVAYVESMGTIHAIDLRDGRTLWEYSARGAVIDDTSVYACAGTRFVELDRASGIVRSSYSTGGCRVVGASHGVVLVRYDAPTLVVGGVANSWAGVIAFARRPGAAPRCEPATITGHVTVDGVPAPGLTVRAGNGWVTEASGVTHFFGGSTTATPTATIDAVTAPDGSYAMTVCIRGFVPLLVDPEQARTFAHEEEVDDYLQYVHVDASPSHVVDFALHAHDVTL